MVVSRIRPPVPGVDEHKPTKRVLVKFTVAFRVEVVVCDLGYGIGSVSMCRGPIKQQISHGFLSPTLNLPVPYLRNSGLHTNTTVSSGKHSMFMCSFLNWDPFSDPVYTGAVLLLGPQKRPQFRQLPSSRSALAYGA